MTEGGKGVLAMATAATIWGLSGIYYKALSVVPPIELLSHRTLWSAVFFGIVLVAQGRGREAAALLARPRAWAVLAVSALMIAVNWLLFIAAVQGGDALEASLGYFIFPLFAVALGVLVLKERLSVVQSLAIGLAVVAVAVLTLGLGKVPWIALALATSFSIYGLIKARVRLGPVISVFVETLLLTPMALVWIWGMQEGAWTDLGGRTGGIFGHDAVASAMLAFSGPLTGTPLILFSYATRRIPYATVGLVQYLNPTLQFVVAVALFGEPFTRWHAIAFPLIWGGLALYSWETWRQGRARSRSISAATVV